MAIERSTMNVDVRPGEKLELPGNVTVQFVHKSGRCARLLITAPRDVRISKKADPLVAVDTGVAELHRG